MAAEVANKLDQLCLDEGKRDKQWRTGLVYDELMTQHRNPSSREHPEKPERITRIWNLLEEEGYVKRCKRIASRRATEEEIALQHKKSYVDRMSEVSSLDATELQRLSHSFDSIYLNSHTHEAALLSLGCTLALTQEVVEGKVQNGMAVVRPPGHHAEHGCAKGFCIFNNVAVAAKWAQIHYGVKKVLIVDWDVHHGNGIQHMFEHDPTVLYFSAHRYDYGHFYPCQPDANYDAVGKDGGAGFNINVAWNKAGMHDGDYLAAFHNILMPIAYEFSPDLVLVSCGFDAAEGDPLGRCCLTPAGYSHLLHKLMSLASGRVVVVLEGGYNLTSISKSAAACVGTLLGDPLLKLGVVYPSSSALESVKKTLQAHFPYWRCLKFISQPEAETWPNTSKQMMEQDILSDDAAVGVSNPSGEGLVEGATTAPVGVQAVTNSTEAQESCEGAAAAAAAASVDTSPPQSQTIGEMAANIMGFTSDQVTLYAVTPLTWCPHLSEVQPVPDGGLDVDAPCDDCGDVKECWVCLQCYKVLCGRFVHQHMLAHSAETDHHIVLSYSDLSVWCYGCDSYVHHACLYPAKQAAHFAKFQEPMPEYS